MKFSTRAKNMEPSATLAISGKAKAMKREGKPVISFGAGEPDFTSPKAALDAAKEAIDKGNSLYTRNRNTGTERRSGQVLRKALWP